MVIGFNDNGNFFVLIRIIPAVKIHIQQSIKCFMALVKFTRTSSFHAYQDTSPAVFGSGAGMNLDSHALDPPIGNKGVFIIGVCGYRLQLVQEPFIKKVLGRWRQK